ncbi:MAG: sugar phosphate nucleotidyltransferase [Thermodesulfobacteriota bacterium]|nr:sugar phosphate nucleotidyltransferase [Thermodesulfobacteriota bacterium]
MHNICSIILAAGKGTRMKASRPKVLHEILGLPLIYYPIDLAQSFSRKTIIVYGHKKELLDTYLEGFDLEKVVQETPLGTGHAVMQASGLIRKISPDSVLIIPGDMPLVQKGSIASLIDTFTSTKSDMGILTAIFDNPHGYGRIKRDDEGRVISIVEEVEASREDKKIREINTGVYIIKTSFLLDAASRIESNNKKGEFFLTDIVGMADKVSACITEDSNEAHGINSQKQLAHAASVMQHKILGLWMDAGTTIIDPNTTWIGPQSRIGENVEIWPNSHILGTCRIKDNTRIMPNTWIQDSHIAEDCIIGHNSILEHAEIKKKTTLKEYTVIRE